MKNKQNQGDATMKDQIVKCFLCDGDHGPGTCPSIKAGAKGLPEIESSAKFRSDREATSIARKALRSIAYKNQDSGWSKFRCHARLPGQPKAFCGARIENSPNTKHAYSEPCGKCERIVESIPDPAEAENDINKYFRYVSFNSERNPEVNSK